MPTATQPTADIGLIGLAVMGENLVLNMESHGFTVAVYNRTTSKVDDFVNGRAKGKNIVGTRSVKELVGALKRPRKVMIMVKAGSAVDAVIDLEGRNPFNTMAELDGQLFLSEPGNFDAAAEELAGIERFDTATSTSRLLVPERDLGGSVAEIAVTKGCGAAIVAGPEPTVNPTSVVTFDPATGQRVD